MENIAEALKMAGAVLIFVIAISIIIFNFGIVRKTSDTILDYRDRETFYIKGDYYYKTTGTERTVGLETVIPSIFRAYLENYKIVFEFKTINPEPIYKIKHRNGTDTIEKYCLDLETKASTDYRNVVLANDDQKAEFLCGILYRDFRPGITEEKFNKKYNIELSSVSLYDQLKNASKITEYLGVYYQNDDPNVPDVMKTEKRIITYIVE